METFIRKFNIDTSICAGLIDYHNNNFEYREAGKLADYAHGGPVLDKSTKDSLDVYFFGSSKDGRIIKYFQALTDCLIDYRKHYNLNDYESALANNIQYYPPGGGFKKWHCERPTYGSSNSIVVQRALVYMTYLNDVKDGGETEFKYQQVKVKPEKGLTLIWPSDFTHTHRGVPSPTEEKWIATGWFNIL